MFSGRNEQLRDLELAYQAFVQTVEKLSSEKLHPIPW